MVYQTTSNPLIENIFPEFIALKSGTEASKLLRFKLSVFGITVLENGEKGIFSDNESVVKNPTNV